MRAARRRARPSSSSAEISAPSRHTRPADGVSRPANTPSKVDLPAPDAPTMATASPGKMVRSTASSRTNSPSGLDTRFVSFCAEMIGCNPRSAMCRTLLFIALLWLPFMAEATSVLVLGDSLSAAYGIQQNQGWVVLLQQRLAAQKEPIEVVNASISGETTAGAVRASMICSNVTGPTSSSSSSAATMGCGGCPSCRCLPILITSSKPRKSTARRCCCSACACRPITALRTRSSSTRSTARSPSATASRSCRACSRALPTNATPSRPTASIPRPRCRRASSTTSGPPCRRCYRISMRSGWRFRIERTSSAHALPLLVITLQVQPAFGLGGIDPTSAAVLARRRAVYAADGGIALGAERMERQVVLADIVVALLPRDVDHRVELDNAAPHLEEIETRTVWRLPAHEARHPHLIILFHLFQRLDLVDRAAEVRIAAVDLLLRGVDMLPFLGTHIAYRQAEALDEIVLVREGLGKMKAGVDDLDRLLRPRAREDVQKIGGGRREGRGHHDLGGFEVAVQGLDALCRR